MGGNPTRAFVFCRGILYAFFYLCKVQFCTGYDALLEHLSSGIAVILRPRGGASVCSDGV